MSPSPKVTSADRGSWYRRRWYSPTTTFVARLGDFTSSLALLEGDLDEATTLLDESEKLAARAGDTRRLDGIAALRAHIPLYRGEFDEAKMLFEDALARFDAHQTSAASALRSPASDSSRSSRGARMMPLICSAAASGCRSGSRSQRSATHSKAWERSSGGGASPKPEHASRRSAGLARGDRKVPTAVRERSRRARRAELHARLHAEAFADNLREGKAMELQDAIELALASLNPP